MPVTLKAGKAQAILDASHKMSFCDTDIVFSQASTTSAIGAQLPTRHEQAGAGDAGLLRKPFLETSRSKALKTRRRFLMHRVLTAALPKSAWEASCGNLVWRKKLTSW